MCKAFNNMKKVIALFLTLAVSVSVYAQNLPLIKTAAKNDAFKVGERLDYTASYKIGFVNVDIAYVILNLTESDMDGVPAYHINAVGQVYPEYEWFFKMRDVYDVWLDQKTLKPLYFENDILEGDYKYWSKYYYDWDKKQVNTVERNLKWEDNRERTYELTDVSYDALALFYNLRTKDISKMKIGVMDTLQVVFANRIRTIGFRYMGKEEKRIPGMGRVKTVKFICQLANDSGVSFQDGSEFTIWLSDDENLIPLYVDTPIRVGSVRVRLTGYVGVKHPTDIRIKP